MGIAWFYTGGSSFLELAPRFFPFVLGRGVLKGHILGMGLGSSQTSNLKP